MSGKEGGIGMSQKRLAHRGAMLFPGRPCLRVDTSKPVRVYSHALLGGLKHFYCFRNNAVHEAVSIRNGWMYFCPRVSLFKAKVISESHGLKYVEWASDHVPFPDSVDYNNDVYLYVVDCVKEGEENGQLSFRTVEYVLSDLDRRYELSKDKIQLNFGVYNFVVAYLMDWGVQIKSGDCFIVLEDTAVQVMLLVQNAWPVFHGLLLNPTLKQIERDIIMYCDKTFKYLDKRLFGDRYLQKIKDFYFQSVVFSKVGGFSSPESIDKFWLAYELVKLKKFNVIRKKLGFSLSDKEIEDLSMVYARFYYVVEGFKLAHEGYYPGQLFLFGTFEQIGECSQRQLDFINFYVDVFGISRGELREKINYVGSYVVLKNKFMGLDVFSRVSEDLYDLLVVCSYEDEYYSRREEVKAKHKSKLHAYECLSDEEKDGVKPKEKVKTDEDDEDDDENKKRRKKKMNKDGFHGRVKKREVYCKANGYMFLFLKYWKNKNNLTHVDREVILRKRQREIHDNKAGIGNLLYRYCIANDLEIKMIIDSVRTDLRPWD